MIFTYIDHEIGGAPSCYNDTEEEYILTPEAGKRSAKAMWCKTCAPYAVRCWGAAHTAHGSHCCLPGDADARREHLPPKPQAWGAAQQLGLAPPVWLQRRPLAPAPLL